MDQHPEAQLGELRAYAERRGVKADEFIDHGVSGAKDQRPELNAMLAAVRRRDVSAVVVVKLDRLARSLRHLTQLAGEFESVGVDLIVLDQAIDTSSPAGRLLFVMLAAISEFELDLIRERTRSGLAAARRRGKVFGRPRALDEDKRRRLKRMWFGGKSQRHIAKTLGASKGTVAREVQRLKSEGTGR